jgi:hypothetical protein
MQVGESDEVGIVMSRPGPSELPPTPTVEPVAAPPLHDERPTSAQLKGDIESGRTGDKNPVRDPALAPLGTDDEAAGHPPSPDRTALARYYENIGRWLGGGSPSASTAHAKADGQPVLFLVVTGAIGIALVAGVWLSRAGLAGP